MMHNGTFFDSGCSEQTPVEQLYKACDQDDLNTVIKLLVNETFKAEELELFALYVVDNDSRLNVLPIILRFYPPELDKNMLIEECVDAGSIECFSYLVREHNLNIDSLKGFNVYEKAEEMFRKVAVNSSIMCSN